MKRDEEKQQYTKMLVDHYSTLNLSRKQAAEVLNISTATLDRMKENAVGPQYIKVDTNSKSNNGKVFYPVAGIVNYLVDNQVMSV